MGFTAKHYNKLYSPQKVEVSFLPFALFLLPFFTFKVSITPGKTRKLQTLPLTDKLELCDCPGLVCVVMCFVVTKILC